jgi:hypothetical protein
MSQRATNTRARTGQDKGGGKEGGKEGDGAAATRRPGSQRQTRNKDAAVRQQARQRTPRGRGNTGGTKGTRAGGAAAAAAATRPPPAARPARNVRKSAAPAAAERQGAAETARGEGQRRQRRAPAAAGKSTRARRAAMAVDGAAAAGAPGAPGRRSSSGTRRSSGSPPSQPRAAPLPAAAAAHTTGDGGAARLAHTRWFRYLSRRLVGYLLSGGVLVGAALAQASLLWSYVELLYRARRAPSAAGKKALTQQAQAVLQAARAAVADSKAVEAAAPPPVLPPVPTPPLPLPFPPPVPQQPAGNAAPPLSVAAAQLARRVNAGSAGMACLWAALVVTLVLGLSWWGDSSARNAKKEAQNAIEKSKKATEDAPIATENAQKARENKSQRKNDTEALEASILAAKKQLDDLDTYLRTTATGQPNYRGLIKKSDEVLGPYLNHL